MQRVLDEVVRHVASSSLSVVAPSVASAAASASASAAAATVETHLHPTKIISGGGLAAVRSRKPLSALQSSAPPQSSSPISALSSVKKGKFGSDDNKKSVDGSRDSLAEVRVRVKTPEVTIGSAGEAVGLGAQVCW